MPLTAQHKFINDEDCVELQFSAVQTLGQSEHCRAALLSVLDDGRRFILDVGQVEEVDLSFLQTLHAFWRSASDRGASVGWALRPGSVVHVTAKALGFIDEASDAAVDGASFWQGCRP